MSNEWKNTAPLSLDPEADETRKLLGDVVKDIHPDAAFASSLERHLATAHPGPSNTSLFSFNRLAPAFLWILAIALMVFVLDWAIRSLAPEPVPAARITKTATVNAPLPPVDQGTPAPSDQSYDWHGTTLYLATTLPDSPSEAGVYLAQPAEHASLEQTMALAERFGIQGEAYEAPGEISGTSDYVITDGKQSLHVRSTQYFNYTADIVRSFNSFEAVQKPDAESIVGTFLQSRGFGFPFKVEWSDYRSGYLVEPLSPEGTPLRYERYSPPTLLVTLGEDGQVASLQASLLDIQSDSVGQYGILSAGEALQRMLEPNRANGMIGSMNSATVAIQQWNRSYPLDQTLTIYGNVSSIKAADANKPPFIQIDAFPAVGQVTGLERISRPTYVEATGRFVSENGIEKFQVDSWKPSDVNEDGLVGIIQRENDKTTLTTDDGATYLLPDVPDALPIPFEKAFVVGTKAGDTFQWKLIDNRMAAGGGGGGGGGGGSGFYKLNLTGTPVPFPTETQASETVNPAAGASNQYIVQAGDTLLSIASTFGVSPDGLMQANAMKDPDVLSVGQVLIIPGSGAQPVEGLRGMLNITISKQTDGSQSVAYGFLANGGINPGAYMLLEGNGLDALQAYNSRPVEIWGSIAAPNDNGMQVIRVDRYNIPFPDLKVQVLKGKQKLSEIGGQPATLFTTDDGTAYIQVFAGGSTGGSIIGNEGDEVQIECVAIPDETLNGLPTLRVFGGMLAIDPKTGLHINLPITADQPAVVEIPFIGKTSEMPTATIERIELVHFLSDPRYVAPRPDAQPPYFQPAWRFYGHYSNGDEFEVLIQALKDDYLLPELEPGLQPG